jgi:hypothetical protein
VVTGWSIVLAMVKYGSPSGQARGSESSEATKVVESIRADFSNLIEIFERQLDDLAKVDTSSRPYISKAKEAAERGLELSRHLLKVIEGSD